MSVNLSIIILSYNTKDLTRNCLLALIKSLPKNKNFSTEIIVVDNGSTDGSVENIKNQISKIKNTYEKSNIIFNFIQNYKNLGYPKGNNQALKIATGKFVLFLNSDVIVDKINFEKLLNYIESHREIGALTVKVVLSDGNIDPASHRGFPTIWNSFCYFIGLEELLRNVPYVNRLFGRYHLVHLNLASIHEIDSASGAFYLSRKDILKKVGVFDEAFFMYGEDLDLSFRIKKLGYKIVYYPEYIVKHLKYASGLEKKDINTRRKTRYHFFAAMKIFYKKHYEKDQSSPINTLVYYAIDFLKHIL